MHLIQWIYYLNIIQYINNKYYLQLSTIYITCTYITCIGRILPMPIITTYILFRIMK